MRRILVFDLPTRIFHWLFVTIFIGAFYIAKYMDSESPIFGYHMILGLTLSLTVLFRVYWGFFGSKFSKFSSFSLKLSDLVNYFKDVYQNKSKLYAGHNPASSWSTLGFLMLALLLFLTGTLMSQGYKEQLEDIHEILANCFLGLAILHILGVLVHSLQHRTWLPLTMINGKKWVTKSQFQESDSVKSGLMPALVFLFLVLLSFGLLYSHFDPSSRVLNLFGFIIDLEASY